MKNHIIVIDDESHTRIALETILNTAGYRTTVLSNGQEALDVIQSFDEPSLCIDLVLTDIMMPEMSGIELLREMRNNNIDIPTMVFTGHGDYDTLEELLHLGCAGYIEKPFTKEKLLKNIEDVLVYNQC